MIFQGRIGREFGTNNVFLGGDSSPRTIEMIHSVPPEICSGAEVGEHGANTSQFHDRLWCIAQHRF